MQDLDEHSVTDAALAQMADTPDPRLKEIMDAAVRHLHAFAREVRLTPDEWLKGIQNAAVSVDRGMSMPGSMRPGGTCLLG